MALTPFLRGNCKDDSQALISNVIIEWEKLNRKNEKMVFTYVGDIMGFLPMPCKERGNDAGKRSSASLDWSKDKGRGPCLSAHAGSPSVP